MQEQEPREPERLLAELPAQAASLVEQELEASQELALQQADSPLRQEPLDSALGSPRRQPEDLNSLQPVLETSDRLEPFPPAVCRMRMELPNSERD